MTRAYLLVFVSIVLFCSNGCMRGGYGVNYDSNPTGAALICEGQHKGYTPVTLYYDFDDGNYLTQECEAVWLSGATAKYQNDLSYAVKKYPRGAGILVRRPQHPDLDKDLMFSMQADQMRMQQAMMQQQKVMMSEQRSFQNAWQLNENARKRDEFDQSFRESLKRWRSYQ